MLDLVAEPVAIEVQVLEVLPPAVQVEPSGHSEQLSWRGVAGATGVRVGASTLQVLPVTSGSGRLLGVVAGAKEAVGEIVFDSPEPAAPIRSLTIPSLRRIDGDDEIRIRASSLTGQRHLVVTPVVGGEPGAPVVAVGPLPRKKALPAQLVGGSMSGSRLHLPDLAGGSYRVTLVRGDAPEEFDEETISHGDVRLYAAPMPVGLHVDGPDGSEVFALTGPVTTGTTVDLRAALQRHLDAAVAATDDGAPLTATITLRSEVSGAASVVWSTTGGMIERAVEGRLTVDTDGSTAAIALPPPSPGRPAQRTVADVTVVHRGMALHPLSDAIPPADAGLGGPTVREVPVVRRLAPDALHGLTIMRVGVLGWARAATDLRLEVLGASATVTGLTPPSHREPPVVVWFTFDEPPQVDRPVEIALTATRGAFGWVADPEPAVRIAVAVGPDGEHVAVGGHHLALTGGETVATGVELAGTDGWDVHTDQFCTVSLANVVMEFLP